MNSLSTKGRLIVFEGADGCGKTTLATLFAKWLGDQGIPTELFAFPGAEMGTLGRHVYALHHSPEKFDIQRLTPASLQLLHVASHLDAIERRIRPALATGTTVVLDRFWWSTWVYGRVSGVASATLDAMIELERAHWADDQPNVVFLISRATPLRPEPTEKWHRWVEEYETLSAREILQTPVLAISNEGKIEDTFSHVTCHFSQAAS